MVGVTKRNTPRISKCWRDPYRPSLEISQQQSTARQTARRSDVVPGPRAGGGPARTIGSRGEAVARRRASARRRGSEVRPSVPSLAIVAEPIGPARTGEYLVTAKAWPFRRPIVGRPIDGFLRRICFEIHYCSPPRIAVHRHHPRAPFGLFSSRRDASGVGRRASEHCPDTPPGRLAIRPPHDGGPFPCVRCRTITAGVAGRAQGRDHVDHRWPHEYRIYVRLFCRISDRM